MLQKFQLIFTFELLQLDSCNVQGKVGESEMKDNRGYFDFISVILMQGGFVNSDIVFRCDDPTHNPISVWILSLFTQFSGLVTLLSLVSGEALLGGLTKLGLVF